MNRVIAGLLVVSSVVVAVWLPSVSSGNCPKTRVNTSLCPGTYVVCQGQPTGGPQGNKCATLNAMGSAHTILSGPFSCRSSTNDEECLDDVLAANCTKAGSCVAIGGVCAFNNNPNNWVYTVHVKKKTVPCNEG